MFKYILFLTLSILLFTTSCKSSKDSQNQNIAVSSHVIKETVHDTVYVVEADTSKYTATLKVDSAGKINISNVSSIQNGKYLKAPVVKIKNNRLEVDCYAEAQSLYKQWVEQHKFDTVVETKIVIKKVERELTFFQTLQIWIGRIALIIVIIGLTGQLIKRYFKPFKLN